MKIAVLLLAAACAQAADTTAWTPLFDGKSLDGWKETQFTGRGNVEVRDGAIHLGRGRMTGVTLTRDFPRSGYEIRFEAARIEGKDFFAGITFPAGDSHCTWTSGGWDGAMVGLSNVDGYDASENETSNARDFEQGRWYRFRLRVTAARIEAWIDDSLVIELELSHHKVSLRFDETDLMTPLGFASYATRGAVRNIEYRRVTEASGP
ncbi:MAG: DUF1080 domain-containing protein [Bryobacteraceae bacterium]